MEALLERFSDEKVDPHVVLAMSESALTRLGVATMGDRIRMKQPCREAVDCSADSNGVDSVDSVWFAIFHLLLSHPHDGCYLSASSFEL